MSLYRLDTAYIGQQELNGACDFVNLNGVGAVITGLQLSVYDIIGNNYPCTTSVLAHFNGTYIYELALEAGFEFELDYVVIATGGTDDTGRSISGLVGQFTVTTNGYPPVDIESVQGENPNFVTDESVQADCAAAIAAVPPVQVTTTETTVIS